MSLNNNVIPFRELHRTQARQLAKLRSTYGDDAQITHDEKGWIIVDLSNSMLNEAVKDEPYLQDNTDITHHRSIRTFLRRVHGYTNRPSHDGSCQLNTHYASGFHLKMPRLS